MYVRAPSPELYDLDRDPGELNNVIDAHPKEYRELEAQLKALSRIAKDGKERVVVNQMNQATMEKLKSLGYISDFSSRNIELDGEGADPKDHVMTLEILHTVSDHNADQVSSSRKIELLQQAIKNDPTDPYLYAVLIEQYEKANQYQQSLQVCLDAIHHNVRNGVILSQLANLYLREGNHKEAIAYYEQAAQLDPLDVEGQSDLATAYLQNGRTADAERVFKWVLTIQEYVPAYNGLGIIAMQRHDLADARKNFERAIQLDPNYVEAQLNLGILCMQTKDFPCAKTAFRVFLAQAPPATYKDMISRVKYALTLMRNQGT